MITPNYFAPLVIALTVLTVPTLSQAAEPFNYFVTDWSVVAHVWLERTVKYWRETLDEGTRIAVPCEKALNAFKWSNVYQLIACDEGDIKGGEGVYDWLRLPASRPLLGNLEGVEVVTRPDQKQRWDFPTVVKLDARNAQRSPGTPGR